MAEDKLDLPEGYDPDAPPASFDLRKPETEDEKQLVELIEQLRSTVYRIALLEERRKAIQKRALPLMTRPVAIIDPMTGDPVVAAASQAKPMVCDAQNLLKELLAYYRGRYEDQETAEEIATMHWESVLKPREVDTKEGGLLDQVLSRHTEEEPTIPPSVIEKTVSYKKNSAYIGFPKPRK